MPNRIQITFRKQAFDLSPAQGKILIIFRELPGGMDMLGQQTDRDGFEGHAFADVKPGGVQNFSGGIGGQDGQAVEGDDGEEIINAFVEAVVIGHRMII